jgi:hypothetical protein
VGFNPAFVAYELNAIMVLDGINGFDAHLPKTLRAGQQRGA